VGEKGVKEGIRKEVGPEEDMRKHRTGAHLPKSRLLRDQGSGQPGKIYQSENI
jgi:hypothetical protein